MNFSGAAVRLRVPAGTDLLAGAAASGDTELGAKGILAIRLKAEATQGENGLMGIRYDAASRVFSLETGHTLYQMRVGQGEVLQHLYYGRRTGDDMGYLVRTADRGFSGNYYELRENRGYSPDTLPQEYSGSGVGDFRVSAVQATAENGSRSVDLRYRSHRLMEGAPAPEGLPHARADRDTEALEIVLQDAVTGLVARLMYIVWPQKDVIARWVRLENAGSAALTITRAASACVDFPYGEYDVMHFHGRHNMERLAERTALPRGITAFGSRRGMSSHHMNPFVILADPGTGEDMGDCWGFMLAWSGNHLEEFEVDQAGSVRVLAGIHPDGFAWPLQPGESFDTPQALLAFSDTGFNGLSHRYHRLIRDNIIQSRYRNIARPVLVNSWEAVYFDFDAEKLVALAREARSLGMDMLVLDDGWFGARNDDTTSLGDWRVNEGKLGCTLGALSDRVHALGMRFGLWFEPEMVSEDSALYRAHPEWALADPGRRPMMARNQLVLDMSRQDVVDYLFDAMCAVLDSAKIEYVKWDFNRPVANLYSRAQAADAQGTLAYRFVLGTYRLLERLTARYPDLMIEGCSGGGGRFDAGMLYYCPQIWCSDDTDAIERLEIQRGTSYGYPPCAMGAHVSAVPNHQTGRTTPMRTRGVVAQAGTFGYELNPLKLSEAEKKAVRAQVADFRRFDHIVMTGDYYRLGEPGRQEDMCAWMFVSPDRDEALVSVVCTHVRANGPFPHIRLRGLDPEAVYSVDCADRTFTGAALMYGGWSFAQPVGDYPCEQLYLKRV